ncbi:AmmeMemoRadiSam system protein B [Fodinibius halophilus]|uniref:AmmeMemoRadiSam system protein B n=1 Tax=Fodinibius halophilus TaxID=1736908 RepID=A0A6M1TC59_9BACT|nr:AmmeMemoRadiSam system protein B [Fodinibius halophilus]NGP89581.1 AmmeMemoRadiSam system protein B [Fodinibius halophilus]
MSEQQLFNSQSQPIPPLRRDLQVFPVEEDGQSYLYFHDQQGYATPELALHKQAGTVLNLIDGERSINDLEPFLGQNLSKDDLLEFIQFLDKNRLLQSTHFKKHAQKTEETYEQSTIHQSVTAGGSYPANPEELKTYLDEAFNKHTSQTNGRDKKAKALYAPHIDPRVAIDSYVQAFAPIKELKPKRVVVLATSHYASLYPDIYRDNPFVLVNKDFELPLATISRDQEAISEFQNTNGEHGITTQDRAHRMEHSIELHLLFLSYLWDHDFSVVPFLTRGLDDLYYMEDGHLGQQLQNFSTLLRNKYAKDEDTFFLISGDLAHIGKKFGDSSAASTMFDDVKKFDKQFLDHGANQRRRQMLELMKEEMDSFRICGFPPLYTFLETIPNLEGEVLSYDLWDEQERESAVTFGSILYRQP